MSRFIYCYADCHYADCRYAECCYGALHFCNSFYNGKMFYRWCPQNNLKFDAMQLFFTTFNELLHPSNTSWGQFYKHFTSVGYESWFVATSTYFAVVVNYDSKLLKKLVLVSLGHAASTLKHYGLIRKIGILHCKLVSFLSSVIFHGLIKHSSLPCNLCITNP